MECFSNIAKISVGGSSYRSHFCRKNLENVKTVLGCLDLLCLSDSKIYVKGYNCVLPKCFLQYKFSERGEF